MQRPDFVKNDPVVRVGSWTAVVLFLAQCLIGVFSTGSGIRMVSTAIFVAVSLALGVYVVVRSYRLGYRRYATRLCVYMAVLVVAIALLAWVVLTAPGN